MINIIHAYPNLMNLYGEYANVMVLKKRLECAGYEVSLTRYNPGDEPDLSDCDFFYVGSGTESSALAALHDIKRHGEIIKDYIGRGGKALFTGDSCVLVSNVVTLKNGESESGLGLSDLDAAITGKERYAEYVMKTPLAGAEIIGVLNTTIGLSASKSPMFTTLCCTETPGIKTEGFTQNMLFATQFTGPLLVRNPAMLDYFASLAAGGGLPPCGETWMAYMIEGYDAVVSSLKRDCAKKK